MNTGEFTTFGTAHLITLGLVFLAAVALVVITRLQQFRTHIKLIRYTLAGLLLANEFIYLIGLMIRGEWTYKWGLPLQLCDLAIFAVAYCLIKHHSFIWEIAYFWGLGGTLQALLTPDLRVSFPDYIFIKFFLTHGLIVISIIFLAAGLGRPIFFESLKRVFVVTNIYACFIGVFNWLFGSNYLYLCHKPTQPSLLDHMGPWPYYLIGGELMFAASLFIYYAPFFIVKKIRGVKSIR